MLGGSLKQSQQVSHLLRLHLRLITQLTGHMQCLQCMSHVALQSKIGRSLHDLVYAETVAPCCAKRFPQLCDKIDVWLGMAKGQKSGFVVWCS